MKQAAGEDNNAGESIFMALNRLRQRSPAAKERPTGPKVLSILALGVWSPLAGVTGRFPSRRAAEPQ